MAIKNHQIINNVYTTILLSFLILCNGNEINETCVDSDYIGFSFLIPPKYNDNYSDYFSEWGLSKLNHISFDVQVDCLLFARDYWEGNITDNIDDDKLNDEPLHIPELYIWADIDAISHPNNQEILNWIKYTEMKMETYDEIIRDRVDEGKENITSYIEQWHTKMNWDDTNNTDIITNFTENYWYNVWRLNLNITSIETLCQRYLPTPAPTHAPGTKAPALPNIPTASPSSTPTISPTFENTFNTTITFDYAEYSQFFPMFLNYETTQEQLWRDNMTNKSFEQIWGDQSLNFSNNLTFNIIVYKYEVEWLECFKIHYEAKKEEEDFQQHLESYFGYFDEDNYDDECVLNDNDLWDYSISVQPYSPMISWQNCDHDSISDNTTEPDKCFNFQKSAQKFNLYIWYNDDVWTNSLSVFQTLSQNAIEDSLCDLWNNEYVNDRDNILTPQDFWLEVSYFLDFCILADNACPKYENQKNEDELKWYPSKAVVEDEEYNGYKMYATLKSSKKISEKIYQMLTNQERSALFMDYLLRRFEEDEGRANFVISGIAVGDLPPKLVFVAPVYLSWAVYTFVGCCVLFALAGAIHGFGIWGADCIRISGIVYFGLYTWDFYSDIVFDLELLNYDNTEWLFYATTGFIVIPWIANMFSLSKYQNKWCKDDSIRERVYQWFVSWQRLTYALAAISGSAFGTVELANSYVFGLDFFCMGLNERHLKKFNNNRLWSGIIAENAPQLILQFWFLALQDWEPENNIVWLAIISSSLSIGAALLDIYSAKKLFAVLKRDGEYVDKISCSMFVLSEEIREKSRKLQISTYAFRDALAETLTTHPRSVEMHFPIATANGFKMKFTVFSSKLQPSDIYIRLRKDAVSMDAKIEPELPKKIKKVWNLSKRVRVPLNRIEVEDVDASQYQDIQNEKSMNSSFKSNRKRQIKKNNKNEGIEMNLYNQQKLNEGNGNGYDVNVFTQNLNHITSQEIPGMINIDSFNKDNNNNNTNNRNNDDYEAQMAALNAQIAMNQYLMNQQINAMKTKQKPKQQNDDNNVDEEDNTENIMEKQMNEMNNMINDEQPYDPLLFQQFQNQWNVKPNKNVNNNNQKKQFNE